MAFEETHGGMVSIRIPNVPEEIQYPSGTSPEIVEKIKSRMRTKYNVPETPLMKEGQIDMQGVPEFAKLGPEDDSLSGLDRMEKMAQPVFDYLTQEDKYETETPEYDPFIFGNPSELPELTGNMPSTISNTGRLKIATGLVFASEEDQQVGILKSVLEEEKIPHRFKVYDDGSIALEVNGQQAVINAPGFSQQDFSNAIGNILPFMLPGGLGVSKLGKTFMQKAMVNGLTDASIGVAMDKGADALGSDTGISVARGAMNLLSPLGFGVVAKSLGKVYRRATGEISDLFGGTNEIIKSRSEAAERLGIDLTLPQVTDNATALATQRELGKLAPTSSIINKKLEMQNTQVSDAVNMILDNIAPREIAEEVSQGSGARGVSAVKKNIDNIIKLKKDFAREDYGKAFAEDVQINMQPVRETFSKLRTLVPSESSLGKSLDALEREMFDPTINLPQMKTVTGRKVREKVGDSIVETFDNVSTQSPNRRAVKSGTVTKTPVLDENGKVISTETDFDTQVVTRKFRDSTKHLRTDLEGLHNARQRLGGTISDLAQAKKKGSNIDQNLLNHLSEVKDKLDEQMFSASPLYKKANDTFKSMSRLEKMTKEGAEGGLTGKIMKIGDLDIESASQQIFKMGEANPLLLMKTKKIIDSVDPKAWDAMLRFDLERKLDSMMDISIDGVLPNIPGKIESNFFGSPVARKYYKMVMPQRTQRLWADLEESVVGAARGRVGGSGTSAAQETLGRVSESLGGRNFGGLFKPLLALKTGGFRSAYDNRLRAIAEAFVDQNHHGAMDKFLKGVSTSRVSGKRGADIAKEASLDLVNYIDKIVVDNIINDSEYELSTEGKGKTIEEKNRDTLNTFLGGAEQITIGQ